jgi:hypothetical protein
MRILLGLLGIIIGLLLIKYREPIYRFSGKFGFAEKYFGSGGTLSFYLVFGSFLVVISIVYASGFLENIIFKLFSRFF